MTAWSWCCVSLGFLLAAIAVGTVSAQVSPVQVSYLPTARSGAPDTPITIFATVLNNGGEEMQCSPQSFNLAFLNQPVPDGIIGQVRFYAIDNGAITSGANDLVSIPAGGRQDFVAELRVNMAYTGVVRTRVRCFGDTESGVSPRYPLVNDIFLTISDDPQPDIIMIGDTLSQDGTARVGSTGPRAALMTVAAVNIGAVGNNLEITGLIGGFPGLARGIPTTICEIDAAGLCLTAEAESVTIANWATNQIRLFAVRARFPANFATPFYPQNIRLFATVRPAAPAGSPPGIGADGDGIIHEDRPESARTSVAMDVEIGEAFFQIWDPGEPPTASFGCDFRGDFDSVGLRSGMQLGRLALRPDGDGGAIGEGWTELQAGRQPFTINIPDWNSSEGTITLHGSSSGGASPEDGAMPVTVQHDNDNFAFSFNWEGDDAFFNDFLSPGRMRCGGFPARPSEPGIENGPDVLLEGTFTEYDARDDETLVETETVTWAPGGLPHAVWVQDRRTLLAWFQQQIDFGEVNAGDAFISFFALLESGAVRPGEVSGPQADTPGIRGIAFPGLLRDDNGVTRADCYVIVAEDFDGSDPSEDAEVILGVRQGADLDAAIADCLY